MKVCRGRRREKGRRECSLLHANDRLFIECLAKSFALVGILDALFVAYTGEARGLDDDSDAFVIEIRHQDAEAFVLLSNQVRDGDFDVFEGHVGSSRSPYTLAIHFSGRHTAKGTLDQEDRNAVHALAAGAHGGGEVVGVDAVCDPFLFAVDDVMRLVFGQLGLAGQVGDVGTGVRFSDGQADSLGAVEDVGDDAVDQGFLAVLDDRGYAYPEST